MGNNIISEYKNTLFQFKLVKERIGSDSIAFNVIKERLLDLENTLEERGLLLEAERSFGRRDDLR